MHFAEDGRTSSDGKVRVLNTQEENGYTHATVRVQVPDRKWGHDELVIRYTIGCVGANMVECSLPVVSTLVEIVGTIAELCTCLTALRYFSPVEGRGNLIETDEIAIIDESHNANPESMKAAIIRAALFKARR